MVILREIKDKLRKQVINFDKFKTVEFFIAKYSIRRGCGIGDECKKLDLIFCESFG